MKLCIFLHFQNAIVKFEYLDVSLECNYHYLEAFEGTNEKGVYLGKFCGFFENLKIRSTGQSIYLRLTQVSLNGNGLEAELMDADNSGKHLHKIIIITK